jgi:GTPase SAR1 family protein
LCCKCECACFIIEFFNTPVRLTLLQEAVTDVPVVLVGNKTDQWGDRMVTLEEGQRRSKEIGCVCFHEISVRESIEQVDTNSKTVLILELSN